jgi:hypothetical protein
VSAQHHLEKLGFGSELHVTGHASLTAAVPVLSPGVRQVQLPVDQCAAPAGGLGAEHGQLAVLHPARGAGSTTDAHRPT